MVTACAWCQRDDPTLAALVWLCGLEGVPVTHGICEACEKVLLGSLPSE